MNNKMAKPNAKKIRSRRGKGPTNLGDLGNLELENAKNALTPRAARDMHKIRTAEEFLKKRGEEILEQFDSADAHIFLVPGKGHAEGVGHSAIFHFSQGLFDGAHPHADMWHIHLENPTGYLDDHVKRLDRNLRAIQEEIKRHGIIEGKGTVHVHNLTADSGIGAYQYDLGIPADRLVYHDHRNSPKLPLDPSKHNLTPSRMHDIGRLIGESLAKKKKKKK